MNNTKQKGYAILFTMVIVTIISVITIGLSSTTQKQNTISSVAKDSRTAFYMADTAIECALYADNVSFAGSKGFFALDFEFNPIFNLSFYSTYQNSNGLPCGKAADGTDFYLKFDDNYISGNYVGNNTTATYTLSPKYQNEDSFLFHSTDPCFNIDIIKTYDYTTGNVSATNIEAKGYSSCMISSGNTVQRQINVSY